MSLFKKDVNLKYSFVYGGCEILKKLHTAKEKRLSFYDISAELTKKGIVHYKQQFFCLMFLYACDIITFNEPYIELNHAT